MSQTETSVTVVVDRTALPDKIAEFEEYLTRIRAAAAEFPGFLDSDVIHPEGTHRYILVFRFASQQQLDDWSASKPRCHWVEKIDQVVEEPTKLITLTGLETWFYAPGGETYTPPPKYKMAIISYLAIAPTIMVFNLIFGRFLVDIPGYLAIYITAPFIVLLMTYAVMPLMTKLFQGWLFAKAGK
ncbi:antibiotic biosynthesis monooxygenase [Maricaulis sp.]|uniref:antibiotic biosynthesis monooxygenase n=1 Tax=Maricaulis sp. TaxID=1486257 RepID=UPI00261E26C0|nr:antibiotic biosynthesis monooxygenase [Maricaulis sp.]